MRIRKLQEELERGALELAVSAVAEVERAIKVDETALMESQVLSREALKDGDRGEWLLADAQGEVARANMDKLGVLLGQREAEVPVAMERFLARRREAEQVKVLVDEAGRVEDAEGARREQAAADEWVISRWNRAGL